MKTHFLPKKMSRLGHQIGLIFTINLLWQTPCQANEWVIGLGQSLEIKSPQTQTVRVEDKKKLKVYDHGQKLIFVGKKMGRVNVDVGNTPHVFYITSSATADAYIHLQKIITPMRGLELKVADNKLIIEGELLRASDWKNIAESVSHKNVELEFKAKIQDKLKRAVVEHFTNLLKPFSLSLEISFQPYVHASLPADASGKKEVEKILKPYGLSIWSDSSLESLKPLIQVQIIMAEVNKKFHRKLGIEWPTSLTANVLPAPTKMGESEISLQFLEENGDGQILASPQLLTRSGSTAEFLAGGEFPIKLGKNKTYEVVWKKHGILLKIKPIVDRKQHIKVELTSEISLLQPGLTVDGIPALKTNRVETSFDLEQAQSIILSGLSQSGMGVNVSGLPYLSQIPILGRLFSSHDFQTNQTELIVIVKPQIVSTTKK